MDYKEIMELLIDNGMDSRLQENPEAVEQIVVMIDDEMRRKGLTSRVDCENYIKGITKKEISYFEKNGDKTIGESDNNFSIEPDGSFLYKGTKRDGRYLVESTKVLAIGEKHANLIVSTSEEVLTNWGNDEYSATARVSIEQFNKFGLEISRREIEQDASIKIRNRLIKRPLDVWINYGAAEHSETSPVTEFEQNRLSDLLTIDSSETKCRMGSMLGFVQKSLIKNNKNNDIYNPIPLSMQSGQRNVEEKSHCKVPNFIPEYGAKYIKGFDRRDIELFRDASDELLRQYNEGIYMDSCKNSKAFRETLLEQAKEDKKLAQVVDDLGLIKGERTNEQNKALAREGIVTVSDLKQVYEQVRPGEMKDMFKAILEEQGKIGEIEQDYTK